MYDYELDQPFQTSSRYDYALDDPFGGGNTLGNSVNWNSIIGGAGQIGAGIGDLNSKNPADAAMPYLEQIGPRTAEYLDPYTQAGGRAIPTLEEQYQMLLQNPSQLMNQIGAGYQASPGYQYNLEQAMGAAQNAAAAGGQAGSLAHQQAAQRSAVGLASQDYGQYVDRALGNYTQGLGGYEGLYRGGLQAGTSQADLIASQLATQAQLAYEGQAAENKKQAGGWGNILGGAAGAVGGAFLGGPKGATAGYGIGSNLGSKLGF